MGHLSHFLWFWNFHFKGICNKINDLLKICCHFIQATVTQKFTCFFKLKSKRKKNHTDIIHTIIFSFPFTASLRIQSSQTTLGDMCQCCYGLGHSDGGSSNSRNSCMENTCCQDIVIKLSNVTIVLVGSGSLGCCVYQAWSANTQHQDCMKYSRYTCIFILYMCSIPLTTSVN